MNAHEAPVLGAGDDPAGLLLRPREAINSLLQWFGGLWKFLDGDGQAQFDPLLWETAVLWIEALTPELERRGFVGQPVLDPQVDPVGYCRAWDNYLLRVYYHVWNGDPLSVEMGMAAMSVKH